MIPFIPISRVPFCTALYSHIQFPVLPCGAKATRHGINAYQRLTVSNFRCKIKASLRAIAIRKMWRKKKKGKMCSKETIRPIRSDTPRLCERRKRSLADIKAEDAARRGAAKEKEKKKEKREEKGKKKEKEKRKTIFNEGRG